MMVLSTVESALLGCVLTALLACVVLAVLVWRRCRPIGRRTTTGLKADDADTESDDTPVGATVSHLYFELREDIVLLFRDCIIESRRITLEKEIGKGKFSSITYSGSLVVETDVFLENEKVVVKSFKRGKTSIAALEQVLVGEAMTLGLSHGNVLSMIGVCINGSRGCARIILPFMTHGSLKEFLINPDNVLPIKFAVKMWKHIAEGLAYLVSRDIVHGHLAAANCMLDHNHAVKITDFWLAGRIKNDKLIDVVLPLRWMAPETLADISSFSQKSDIWSYGVLIWEIMTRGLTPYGNIDLHELKTHIEEGHILLSPSGCPHKITHLMGLCLAILPQKRTSSSEVVAYLTDVLSPKPQTENQENHPSHETTLKKKHTSIDVSADETTTAEMHNSGYTININVVKETEGRDENDKSAMESCLQVTPDDQDGKDDEPPVENKNIKELRKYFESQVSMLPGPMGKK